MAEATGELETHSATTETTAAIRDTAKALVAYDKGILAMDESTSTIGKRFAEHSIPQTIEARQAYRELLVTTPGLGEFISGAILFDETIRQSTRDGVPFVDILRRAGIIPGIKVDLGAKAMAGFDGEKVTEGLDGLRDRLQEYASLGARFAKWRAVITIGDGIPTPACITANAHALARYAALCQEAGLTPIVEPEVLMDGAHSLDTCYRVTQQVLNTVFDELFTGRIDLEGMLLKPNMIVPGEDSGQKAGVNAVAEATVRCLRSAVPAAVPGIVFLSGGQCSTLATQHLNAMNKRAGSSAPWALSFSFGRALQEPALGIWKGSDANVHAAQQSLLHRAMCNGVARRGEYNDSTEHATAAQLRT